MMILSSVIEFVSTFVIKHIKVLASFRKETAKSKQSNCTKTPCSYIKYSRVKTIRPYSNPNFFSPFFALTVYMRTHVLFYMPLIYVYFLSF